jgi:cytochrome b6-f complex iron-sulfur subunit
MADSDSGSRRFFNAVMGLGFLSTLGGFAGTALAYLWPVPNAGAQSEFLSTARGKVSGDQLGENEAVVGRSLLGKVLVVRKDGQLRGVQATCTHLGCTVAWNGERGEIECPCHGARYDLDGRVLKGPARDPLERVEVRDEAEGLRIVGSTS